MTHIKFMNNAGQCNSFQMLVDVNGDSPRGANWVRNRHLGIRCRDNNWSTFLKQPI